MQYIIPFDPTLTTGSSFNAALPNGGWLLVINESPVGVTFILGDGRKHLIPPNFYRCIRVNTRVQSVDWTQTYTLPVSQAPISQIFGEAYNPDEWTLGEIMGPLPRQINLGNPPVGGVAKTLLDDSDAAGTQFIESTPTGQGFSSFNRSVDAAGFEQVLSANTAKKILNVTRGDTGATKAIIVLGDSGDLSITTLQGTSVLATTLGGLSGNNAVGFTAIDETGSNRTRLLTMQSGVKRTFSVTTWDGSFSHTNVVVDEFGDVHAPKWFASANGVYYTLTDDGVHDDLKAQGTSGFARTLRIYGWDGAAFTEALAINTDGSTTIPVSVTTPRLNMNGTLSASNQTIDLQQAYGLYSDNTGNFGTTRIWLNGPDRGEFQLGPRTGSNYFDWIRLRATRVTLDLGKNASPNSILFDVQGGPTHLDSGAITTDGAGLFHAPKLESPIVQATGGITAIGGTGATRSVDVDGSTANQVSISTADDGGGHASGLAIIFNVTTTTGAAQEALKLNANGVAAIGTDDAGTKRRIQEFVGTTDPAGRTGITPAEGDLWFNG